MDRPEGFIVPPPGLLPEPKKADKGDSPRRTGETTESYPAFFPRTLGVPRAEPTRRGNHAAEASAASPVVVRWDLTTPDGTRIPITQATVVGRNPTANSDAPDAVPVALADPQRSLSKSHALLVPSADALSVTDLHSTNGVAVILASGHAGVAEPGVAIPAPDGSELALGNLRLRVSRA